MWVRSWDGYESSVVGQFENLLTRGGIVRLLVELGAVCSKYQDEELRGLSVKRVQCDEIWSFVGSKEKNTTPEKKAEGCGDCWTWTALDADTKIIISFRLGDRTLATAYDFMHDVAERISNRIQLTTDGHRVYLEAVESAFGLDIDYAMLNKVYRANPEGPTLYSPAKCIGVRHQPSAATQIRNTSQRPTSSARI